MNRSKFRVTLHFLFVTGNVATERKIQKKDADGRSSAEKGRVTSRLRINVRLALSYWRELNTIKG